eukprot:SAG31_NODE_271_length_18717_cov_8.685949_18_plen_55_part_00
MSPYSSASQLVDQGVIPTSKIRAEAYAALSDPTKKARYDRGVPVDKLDSELCSS